MADSYIPLTDSYFPDATASTSWWADSRRCS